MVMETFTFVNKSYGESSYIVTYMYMGGSCVGGRETKLLEYTLGF